MIELLPYPLHRERADSTHLDGRVGCREQRIDDVIPVRGGNRIGYGLEFVEVERGGRSERAVESSLQKRSPPLTRWSGSASIIRTHSGYSSVDLQINHNHFRRLKSNDTTIMIYARGIFVLKIHISAFGNVIIFFADNGKSYETTRKSQ